MTRCLHLADARSSAARSRQPCGTRTTLRLGWVAVCLAVAGAAQAATVPLPKLKLLEYQKQNWQVEDGLPENNIRMISQGADGSLILATGSGISSFDGTRFRDLPLDTNGPFKAEAINAILFDKDQGLWVGTDGRGVMHRTANGTVNISEQAGRFNERTRALMLASDGAVWIATQNGVERYAGNRLEVIDGSGMISGDITTVFAEDGTGGMFFVTSSGLYHWQKGIARPVTVNLPAADAPVAIYRDVRGRLWLGTMSHVLELVQPTVSSPGRKPSPAFTAIVRAVVPSPVTTLVADAEGSLWIGTRHEGLFHLTPDGLAHWGLKDGLADEAIRSLFIDREQNLWIGLLGGGLSRWRKSALAPFGAPEGFTANYAANALADHRGDLWLGTWGNGLFRLHQDHLRAVALPGMPVTTPIRALAEDGRGSVWVGTWFQGLYRIDGGHGDGGPIQHFLLGNESPGNAISVILPDRSGGLWIGTYTGLMHFPSGVPDQQKRSQYLSSQLITALLQDVDGSILVGTSTGLYRIRSGSPEAVPGLSQSHIQSLFLDRLGYAWAGTKGDGLFHIATQGVTRLTNAAIPDLTVNTGSEDKDGHLWLGTMRGILRLSVAEMHALVDGKSSQLTTVMLGKADGMQSSECRGPSEPGSTMLPNGTLWFATAKGFVHTTEAAEALGKTTPRASIEGWSTSNDPNGPMHSAETASRLELEAGQPDLLLFYNASLLSNPDQVEYRYRLVPYDTQWTITHSHAARYRRLPPGSYRFEVQARLSGEQWNSTTDSITVKQQPFFYETWYFKLGCLLLVVLAALQLYRRRVRLMKGRMGIVLAERSRIASDCHDSLMAGFAAVSWQLEATAKLFHDSGVASTPAAESCELARSMVAHCQAEARRIIWDLRTTDEVTSHLSEALDRMLAGSSMRQGVQVNLAVEGEEQPLPPSSIHHLVCIAQEALSNAIRHAEPEHIEVRLRYEPDAILLSVHDDGKGFPSPERQAVQQGHFGIAVMAERARKLGGTLRMQSRAGNGTEVNVRVAFTQKGRSPKERHSIRWIGI